MTYSFYSTGMPFVLAVILTLLVGIVLGFLTERIFLDKLIGEPILAVIMVTVGLSFFLKGLSDTSGGRTPGFLNRLFLILSPSHWEFSRFRRSISGLSSWPSCCSLFLCAFSNTPAGGFPCRPRPMTRLRPCPWVSAHALCIPRPGPLRS